MKNDYFVGVVLRIHKKSPIEVEEKFRETFGVPFSEKVLYELSISDLKTFVLYVKSYISVKQSPLTVEQIKEILLASEIQSAVSLKAFTKYQCKLCGTEEMWHNSAAPNLCDPCRERAAMNVIRSGVLNRML